jgi:hypothetical protein
MKEIQEIGNESVNRYNNSSSKRYGKLFTIISILNFVAIIFTIIFLLIFLFQPNSFKGNNINEYSNDYCLNKTNEYYEFLCTNKYYKNLSIKKSKFIWILTDGTAADQLTSLGNLEKYKIASSFLVEGDDIVYKHTNELHEALITGKHNRNIKGKEINYDNIIQQMVKAGYKINYRGWGLPIPDIIGDKKDEVKKNKTFHKKFIDDDHEILAFSSFCNITNPFPFLNVSNDKYQNPTPNNVVTKNLLDKINGIVGNKSTHLYNHESKLELYEELDELFKEYPIDLFTVNIGDCLTKSFDWNAQDDISIIYYTTEVDHFNHLYGKNYINTVLQMYITEKMIERIMDWIDVNEDYVLIVSSDHGGQKFFGEDSLINHGEDVPGNEAIFFVYSKELKDHYDELKMRERYINIIDENEIIAQVLERVSIPINSRGFPLKLINSDINHFISLKMKELQLIQLIEKYLEKYNKYESSLKDTLSSLKVNFSKTDSTLKEYMTDDLDIKSDKAKDFKTFLKSYEKSLSSNQKKIFNIIDWKNKTAGNIILYVIIFIFAFLKCCLEIYIISFKIFEIDNAGFSPNKRKCFFLLLFIFIFIYILFFYSSVFGTLYLRESIIYYCLFMGYFFSCSLLYVIIFNFRWKDNKIKRIISLCSISIFTVLCQHLGYSDCFYKLKENFTYISVFDKSFIKFFSFFVIFYFLIMREVIKFGENQYFICICKKPILLFCLMLIYFIFLISIYIEDITQKDLYEQNIGNSIFVCINFICFIILLIISHFTVYQANRPKESSVNEDNIDNRIDYNPNLKQSSNTAMPSSKEKYINRNENNNNNNSQNVSNDLTNKNIYLKNNRVEGLPGIKIFLFLTFCWISDHGEKLFGLIILVPFLEIMDYLSQDFQAKMNEKPNEDTNETRPVEVADSINSNHTTENKPKNNMYVYYFLFYFISQDMFLIGNHSAFALLKYSFGFENDKTQQIKAIKVFTLLRPLFSHVTKYRYGLIILGYFLEKSIYDNNNKGEYSKDFLLRKILLGIRIGMDMIYIFYQILINVNDKLFVQLFIYSFVNISLFLMDYLGFAFTKLGRLICG